jgi:hypothetical protein
VIVAGLLFLPSLKTGSVTGGIQSGAEGPQVYVYGWQPGSTNTISQLNDQSLSANRFNCFDGAFQAGTGSCYDNWVSGSAIYSSNVGLNWQLKECYFCGLTTDNTTISVALNVPQQPTQSFGGLNLLGAQYGQSISYYTAPQSGMKTHVSGQVMQAQFVMEFKPNGSPNLLFTEEAEWFHLFVNIWQVQMCDPANTTACQNGVVWGAPLEAIITQTQQLYCNDPQCSSTSSGQPQNDQLNPMSTGAALSLYNNVGTSAPVGNPISESTSASNWQTLWSNYLAAGGSPYSPDPQIYQDTYYPIAFTNFGPFGCGGFFGLGQGTCYPDVTLTVTVYYLVIGTFIWTNPNTTTYAPTPQSKSPGAGDYFSSFVSSLLSVLGIGTIIVLVVIIILAFILAPVLGKALSAYMGIKPHTAYDGSLHGGL